MLYVPYKSVPGGKYCSIRTYSDILYRYKTINSNVFKVSSLYFTYNFHIRDC